MITSSIKNICHSIKWAFYASDSVTEPFLYTADFMAEEGWPGLITPPAPNHKLSKTLRSIFKPTNTATTTTTTTTTTDNSDSNSTTSTTNRKSTQGPNTSFSPSLVTYEMFYVAKAMEHKDNRPHIESVETIPTIIPEKIHKEATQERTEIEKIAELQSVVYPTLRVPEQKIDTSSILSGCLSFTEKKLAFRNGLKNCDDKTRLSFKTIKQKLLKRSLYPLEYFQSHSEDEYSFEFESLNHEDFKSIRGCLGIEEAKFKKYFNSPYFNKELEAYDPERSKNGRFRINVVPPEQAYFLHKSVQTFKHYFKYHRNTFLQCYVGLFRVGGTFLAIEDLRPGRLPLNYSLHVSKTTIDFTTEWWQNVETLRASTFKRRSELKAEKKILFSDLRFLKQICSNFGVINLGIAKTDSSQFCFKFERWIESTVDDCAKTDRQAKEDSKRDSRMFREFLEFCL